MSSSLSSEIAKLPDDVRHKRIHDFEVIKQVTMVTGYAHLVESHPGCVDYSRALEEDIHALVRIACGPEHAELCEQSRHILASIHSNGHLSDAA